MPSEEFKTLISTLFKPHPLHGQSPGPDAPHTVRAFIEMVPLSAVKLELDKHSGALHVDRPQVFSSTCPTLYGYVPQTYCGARVAQRCKDATGLKRVKGDGDPLDICVLTARPFLHGDLTVTVKPIGGLRMVDRGEADDKIIAILEQDIFFGEATDIGDIPKAVVTQLQHYFLSYKRPPGGQKGRPVVSIKETYGRDEAKQVILASMEDYREKFGTAEDRLQRLHEILVEAAACAKQK